ncbi:bifunctional glyoxylate/hydroxypyruvate reductase B [Alkalihalophilus pseudofirmus]|nr:bifunctional glyoxylate/hydroxypyruvate reductase B [Alkalihalophilus pseudofirmus]
MKQKVIVAAKMYDEPLSILKKWFDVVHIESVNDSTRPSFLEELSDAHGLINMGLIVDQHLLNRAPHLKIVSNISVGYDNLDIAELTLRGIMATNTPDVLNDTTADAVMALLLSTARRIPELDQYVKRGEWKQLLVRDEMFGVDIHGKTLGIIGMGRIGTAIAKRAHLGFDMEILYYNRNRNMNAEELYQCKYCSLEELLQRSDFICLMTPLTKETEYLIGKKQFEQMKRSAIFINASRGMTVNEKDLIMALENKWIAAAGLDVYEQEPIDPSHRLLTLPNVVTLPHIGGATLATRMKMMNLAVNNIVEGLMGNSPPHLINKDVVV